MFYFCMKNYKRFSGLKKHLFISSKFYGVEIQAGLIGFSADCVE